MEFFALSDVGKKRERNEDSFWADGAKGFFMVCDGMGGHKGGDVASRLAVEAMRSFFERRALPEVCERAEETILQALQIANRRIWEAGREDESLFAMGTTLTAVFIRERLATVAHIGDSALYLFRDGGLRKLTLDHTLAEKMRAEGGSPGSAAYEHVLTRALGMELLVRADITREPLLSGDVLLLCSDGLTVMLPDETIRLALAENAALPEAAAALVGETLERGGFDNVTVLLVRIE
jgi:protein phosphatase